ncbi:hypothetical protein [Clostridium tagluense]|uniref:Uncharacterized protein n=1 Tax=Clostridium tagluense TaxID=360422 RepID=A0A401USU3_9CLOT|nr:hypothetical protein [Clostridium tagluense]GCD12629.1 hypothetical protein Ctaglu_42520 [Clostridium tagluense]
MLTKNEILAELKTKISTDYSGWLSMLLRHIEEYGETPKFKYIGLSYENNKLWDGEQIHGRSTIIGDADSIYLKDNKVYEIRKCELFLMDCTAKEYMNYRKPMPYNVYIMG